MHAFYSEITSHITVGPETGLKKLKTPPRLLISGFQTSFTPPSPLLYSQNVLLEATFLTPFTSFPQFSMAIFP